MENEEKNKETQDILEKIRLYKLAQADVELVGMPMQKLRKCGSDTRRPLNFMEALSGPGLGIIAEIKKASPSKGIIRENFDPLAIAYEYANNGADCISVLTDEKFFMGKKNYIADIKNEIIIPILRKDFIVDARQVRESYDLGADAILLIAAILSKEQLVEFKHLAETFGMAVLVEVHTVEEAKLVTNLGFQFIGVNNRDLRTFKTELKRSIDIKPHLPPAAMTVSESGIATREDCEKLRRAGYDAVLVGESLMRERSPGEALFKLKHGSPTPV